MKTLLTDVYNVYCDESCHLEVDKSSSVMLLGCMWIPRSKVKIVSEQLKSLKTKHKTLGELKWVKVSHKNQSFYEELCDWFFDQPDLHFRGLVVTQKQMLDHKQFNEGSHDTFYYKMHFLLLRPIVENASAFYNVFLDVKDTRSRLKVKQLKSVLCSSRFDFAEQQLNVQCIRSHEAQLLQLTDFFLGALSYKHRELQTSDTKLALVSRIEKQIGQSLLNSTRLTESKFNIFVWTPQKK